jgi:hypothetical protein
MLWKVFILDIVASDAAGGMPKAQKGRRLPKNAEVDVEYS